MIETEPELRMGSRNRWTSASLRDLYRYRISHRDGSERLPFAYAVLSQMASDSNCSRVQMRAVAEGLELGMTEGIR
jgi:hypothetical protein